jgi:hypothetical protein
MISCSEIFLCYGLEFSPAKSNNSIVVCASFCNESEMTATFVTGFGKTSTDGFSTSADNLNGAVLKNCLADQSEVILGSTLQIVLICQTYFVLAERFSIVFCMNLLD